jgi:hypothetical protein
MQGHDEVQTRFSICCLLCVASFGYYVDKSWRGSTGGPHVPNRMARDPVADGRYYCAHQPPRHKIPGKVDVPIYINTIIIEFASMFEDLCDTICINSFLSIFAIDSLLIRCSNIIYIILIITMMIY